MLHNPPLKALDEKAGSSRWHSLKDTFRYLFAADHVPVVEDWYNLVAPQRHREAFREVAKGIHQAEPASDLPQDGQATLEAHRAAHMMQLYGHVMSAAGKAKARSWLLHAEAPLIDKFRDVFTAIGKSLAVQTTTKEAYVQRQIAEAVNKDRNRRKIDWNHTGAAEQVRQTTHNPMAGQRLPQIPAGTRRSSANADDDADTAARRSPNLDTKCDSTFQHMHDRQRQNTLEGVYTVDAGGCTVYQPKPRGTGKVVTAERVINTLGNHSSSWKSTTRDHIRNHGAVKPQIVSAEKHPAIARVTASLGLCVPTLKPKAHGPQAAQPRHV